jgi:hypothetical protein
MKIINKFLMTTLILSVFFGCKKDDDENPLAVIAGTYEGPILIVGEEEAEFEMEIQSVPITIVPDNAGKAIVLTISEGIIPVVPVVISATCPVTINGDNYSFSGATSIPVSATAAIPITIGNSSITKGKAEIKIKVELPEEIEPGITLNATFSGQKK